MSVDPYAFRLKEFLERYEALCATYGIFVSCGNDAECCAMYAPVAEERQEAVLLHVTILRGQI